MRPILDRPVALLCASPRHRRPPSPGGVPPGDRVLTSKIPRVLEEGESRPLDHRGLVGVARVPQRPVLTSPHLIDGVRNSSFIRRSAPRRENRRRRRAQECGQLLHTMGEFRPRRGPRHQLIAGPPIAPDTRAIHQVDPDRSPVEILPPPNRRGVVILGCAPATWNSSFIRRSAPRRENRRRRRARAPSIQLIRCSSRRVGRWPRVRSGTAQHRTETCREAPPAPGTSLGHYDVTALLGAGGMGQVW